MEVPTKVLVFAVALVVYVINILLCLRVARKKNRAPIHWTLVAAAFPILASPILSSLEPRHFDTEE
jgi:hypothetical protein